MIRLIVIRFIQSIIALIGIAFAVFILVRASGDPTDLMRNSTSTEEDIQMMRVQMGLDKSYSEQFVLYVSQLVRLDFGTSLIRNEPVRLMIGRALPNSLRLIIPSFILGMLISTLLGVFAATRKDTMFDNGVKFLAILGQALPNFWLAIILIFVFSVWWPILPAAGMETFAHYIQPVFVLTFFLLPGMMRLVRSAMLDTLDSEYVKLARIKGISERKVVWKHALRNALIAPLTTAGMILVFLLGGTILIENVYNWPGMGRLILEGAVARDYPVVQGTTLLFSTMVLAMNLIVDIAYGFVDPQIRFQRT